MKVQFIWPNFDCPIGLSVGVAYLSGALQAAGHETRIIHISEQLDYPFDIERVLRDVWGYGPDLIAMSTGTNHYPETRQLLERIKSATGLPIVLGGLHATLNAAQVMDECPFVDFLVVGEGDDALVELVEALGAGTTTWSIQNLCQRCDGALRVNPPRPLKDLSQGIPPMDLDGWSFERITRMRRGWVNVYMNRGCPYRCTYCHNNGVARLLQGAFGAPNSGNEALGFLRLRSIDDMLAELRSILERYDFVSAFSFNDDTFTMDRDHTRAFLSRYRDEIRVPFVCNTTVLDVDRELLELMKDAGCDLVRFGVETATPRIRRKILKRDFSIEKTEQVFDICREIELRSFTFNILANPSESRDEMLDTLKLTARLQPSGTRVSLGFPYPGTEYHEIASAMDLIEEGRQPHNYLSESTLKWSDQDRLWIDKLRTTYWWWINRFLANEASSLYGRLIDEVERIDAATWAEPTTRRRIGSIDRKLSEALWQKGVPHYVAPFEDRPEIALLYDGKHPPVARPTLDEH